MRPPTRETDAWGTPVATLSGIVEVVSSHREAGRRKNEIRCPGHPSNVDKDVHDHLNDSEAAALDAGVATHEGYHVGHGPFGIFGFQSDEHGGYYIQSVTYQGLHNTDRISELWNESWLTVDKDKLSIERDREHYIQQAVDVANEKKKDNKQ